MPDKTIGEIKKIDTHDISGESALDRWFQQLIQKRVSELTILDISRMLRQNIFLDIAIPMARQWLNNDPNAGEMYEGQLAELLRKTGGDG